MSTSPQITPRRILATLQAYRDAAALNTAIELELFTRIAHGTDTAHKIANELDIPVRGVRLLCEYLASTGLIEKEDEQLRLTGDVALYLDKKSPAYLGSTLGVLYTPPLLRGFEHLTESVRAGRSANIEEPKSNGRPEWIDLARGLTDPAVRLKAFAETVNLPAGQRLKILDLGARDGAFGIAIAARYPNSIIVALDSPEALHAAQKNADAAKLGTRYQNVPGDPMVAQFGMEYDAVVIADHLYQFEPSQITSLLMRIHHALKKTGQLFILEFLSNDSPEFIREFSGYRLNVLAANPNGEVYSVGEMKGMIESSGFHSVHAQPLPAACATLLTASV